MAKVRVLHVRWRGAFLVSAAIKLDDLEAEVILKVAGRLERTGLSLTFI